MRWFSTLIFSPSSSSSSSAHSSSSDAATPTRGLWVFWTGKRSRRSRKLQQLGDHVGNGKSHPMWHETVDDIVVTHPTSLSRSPSVVSRSSTSSFDRCYNRSTSVAPQPLPLPELVSSAVLRNNRDADSRLPSPKYAVGPTSVSKATQVDGAVDAFSSTGFRMRSVFASQKKNKEQVETRTPGMATQDTNGAASTRSDSNFWISVPARSVPSSPFGSPTIKPHITRNEDFVPYHYVTPKTNQFWSAPEMPKYETLAGLPLPAFFDLSSLGSTINNNSTYSPHQSPRGTSPCQQQHPKSPSTRSSSPMPRRENIAPLTVHPLPLPPWAGSGAGAGSALPSPSSTYTQPGTKTEPLSMKSKWQKGKLIGRGTFGSVYVATNRENGALCAMKEAEIFSDDPKSAECIKQLEQEIKVLSHLKHPNIVQYYGSEIVEDKFYIFLEYIHPGSINKYVRDHCGAITESVVRSFTRHILSGLAYLHSKKTVHRDIKGANLLVDSAGVVKLADFGMAKHLTGHSADLSLKGSPYWMAPELMQAVMQKDNSSDLAFAVDIWSLGCTIIEMFTGKPPWSEYEGAAAMFKVMKDTPPIPETLSPEGKDFLRLCFKRNPAERPTASMLLDHRFLKNNLQQQDISSERLLHNSGGTVSFSLYS
ncbi:PREDICTED: mitogen-activated protein kinase kinase kinase YODA-like isoform X1 [Lupinus angustifolius]|nr:PREDICTED: mitogen-activated protein kinase kinase kinase YODA-like isoform X1 [Lupinus angustifolius]